MMSWLSFLDWMHQRIHGRRKPRPARPFKSVQPVLEQCEKRILFANQVWLPLRLGAFDGTNQADPAAPLFRPALTQVLPEFGLQSASLSLSGLFSLTDTGAYSLSLNAAGPDGSTACFAFSENGSVTFNLVELGSFTQAGFSANSVVLTQTAALSWSFLETDGAGNTISFLSGLNTFTLVNNGAAPFDPNFWVGYNWADLTRNVSDLNGLGLPSLTASSLSLTENGTESYLFQETNAVATVAGSNQQTIGDLNQTGQQNVGETTVEQFAASNQGNDTFALSALGQYANASYALSSVAYLENGNETLQLSATVSDAQSGTGTGAGLQSFSGHNHSLNDQSADSFQLSNLQTTIYQENAAANYTLAQSGNFAAGSFALGSLAYTADGTGGYSLTQTALQTQSGTFAQTDANSGTDSTAINGTVSDSGTVSQAGQFTATTLNTVQDSESGNLTLSELGAYGNGSWALSSVNLSEVLSGTFSTQVLTTLTQSAAQTATDSGTASDSYALGDAASQTVSGNDLQTSADTQTSTANVTSVDNSSQSGSSGETLILLGAVGNGSVSLSCYVFQSSQSGTWAETNQNNESDSGSGSDSVSDQSSDTATLNFAGTSASAPSSGSDTGNDSFSLTALSSLTSNDAGSFSNALYEHGSYGGGSWALDSVARSNSQSDNWSVGGSFSSGESGSSSDSSSGTDSSNGTSVGGGDTFTGLGSDSVSESDAGAFGDNGSNSVSQSGAQLATMTEQGTYGQFSFSYGSVVYQVSGSSTATTISGGNDSVQTSGTQTITSNQTQGANGSAGVAAIVGLDTYAGSDHNTLTATTSTTATGTSVSTDSWSLYEAGAYSNGSYSFASVAYADTTTTTWSSQAVVSTTRASTDTAASTDTTNSVGTSSSAGITNSGLATLVQVNSSTGTFSSTELDTITATGSSVATVSELGSFGGLSYSFGSVVMQEQDSSLVTTQASGSDSYTLTSPQSTTLDGVQGAGASSIVAGLISTMAGQLSLVQTLQGTVTDTGQDSFSRTDVVSDSSTQYAAGCYSLGSYNLSSVVNTDSGNDSWTEQDNNNLTEVSSDSWTAVATLASNVTFSASSDAHVANAGGNAVSTQQDNSISTIADVQTSTGHDTYSQSAQGSYANFSYGYSSVVWQDQSSQSSTLVETGTAQGSSTGGDSLAQNGALNDAGTFTANALDSSQQAGTVNNSDTWTDQSSDSWNFTDQNQETTTFYQAGVFGFGSYAFASVNYQDSSLDTASGTSYHSETQASTQTGVAVQSTASGGLNVAGSVGSAGYAYSSVSTLTQQASKQSLATTVWGSTDSASQSALGCYANFSYAYASTVYQDAATSLDTTQTAGTNTTSGGSQDSNTTTITSGMSGGQGQFSIGNQLSVNSASSDSFSLSATANNSGIDVSSGSSSLYMAGCFAGGSYALSSVVYSTNSSDSFTQYTLDTLSESGTSSTSQTTVSSGQNTTTLSGNFSMVQNGTTTTSHSASDSKSSSAVTSTTQTGLDTSTVNEAGQFSAGSYSFGTVGYTVSSLGTTLTNQTDTESTTESGADTTTQSTSTVANSGLLGLPSGNQMTVTQGDSYSSNRQVTAASLDTATENFSLSQLGSYSNDSYAFGQMTFSGSSQDTRAVTENSLSTSSGSTNDSVQFGSATSGGLAGALASILSGQGSTTQGQSQSATFTVTTSDTVTQNSLQSTSLFEVGSLAQGSTALSSLVYQSQQLATVSDAQLMTLTQTNSSSQSSTQGSNQGGLNGIFSSQQTLSSTSNQSATASSEDDRTSLATSVQSYSIYQAGSYSNGLYAFGSLVYQESASSTLSTLDTQTASESGGQGGTVTTSPTALVSITFGTGILATQISASSQGSATASFSNATFSGNLTQVSAESSTQSYSLYEAGTYLGGTFNLSSVSATTAGTDSLSVSVSQWESSLQTPGQSGSAIGTSVGGQSSVDYQSSSSANGTVVLSSTVSFSLTAQASLTYNAHEEGTYSNGSYSLSSLTESATIAATQSSTQVSINSSTQSGTSGGSFSLGHNAVFNGNTTFLNTDNMTDTLTDQRNASIAFYAAGSASGPSLSLSSFVLSETSNDTQAESRSETGTQSFNGTNSTSTFSGLGTTTTNDSVSQAVNNSWYEAGSFTNASFGLSSVAYSLTHTAGFTYSQSELDSWSGGYSGTDGFTVTANANATSNESALGSYALNSLSVSNYTLSATSSAQLTASEDGVANTKSFGHDDEWSQQETNYQVSNNASFSYSSYTYDLTSTETTSDDINGSNAELVNYQDDRLSGSGHTGTETITISAEYTTWGSPKDKFSVTTQTSGLTPYQPNVQLPDSSLLAMGLAAGGSFVPGSKSLMGVQGMGLPTPSKAGLSAGAMSLGQGWWTQLQVSSWASGALGWKVSPQALTAVGQTGTLMGQPGALPWSLQPNEDALLWLQVAEPEIMGRMRGMMARPALDPLSKAATRQWNAQQINYQNNDGSWWGAVSGAVVGALVGFLTGGPAGAIVGGLLGFVGGGLGTDSSAPWYEQVLTGAAIGVLAGIAGGVASPLVGAVGGLAESIGTGAVVGGGLDLVRQEIAIGLGEDNGQGFDFKQFVAGVGLGAAFGAVGGLPVVGEAAAAAGAFMGVNSAAAQFRQGNFFTGMFDFTLGVGGYAAHRATTEGGELVVDTGEQAPGGVGRGMAGEGLGGTAVRDFPELSDSPLGRELGRDWSGDYVRGHRMADNSSENSGPPKPEEGPPLPTEEKPPTPESGRTAAEEAEEARNRSSLTDREKREIPEDQPPRTKQEHDRAKDFYRRKKPLARRLWERAHPGQSWPKDEGGLYTGDHDVTKGGLAGRADPLEITPGRGSAPRTANGDRTPEEMRADGAKGTPAREFNKHIAQWLESIRGNAD